MQTKLRSGKTVLLLLVGCGLFAVAVGGGIGFFIIHRAQASEAHEGKSKPKKTHKKAASEEIKTVDSLGEFVVNLADTGNLRYAKMSVALGFEEKIPEEKLKEVEPKLRDVVIGVVTRKRFDELHRKGGLARLKKEIIAATADRIPDSTVGEVYFEAFAMQ